ncbi:hypothetical protein P280DRAFT_67417 [Massarina eburnea CBS 473.64]|uniref:Camp independent regulatory protein n=1 Tax=Massarina eburnea CBS 473.64 TaxID=1395130 RepID=A0A6A6RTN0_9PLEO|nr:hypothetical protein P280DRAFT_67417 [Massarina eburnea CBS 473.64]
MLQGIRASSLTMPPFGHNMALAGVHKMDGYSDTDSWHWPQHSTHQSQSYTPIFDPALYAHLTPSLPVPGSVQPRHHSLATSHVLNTGTSTPPPPRQQVAGSMVKAQPDFKPTWHGFLDSTKDAMTIVEAALQGRLSHISRRPHDKERAEMLTSGTVLVYEENASGIKRWTDAVHWSPSRVMNNCLIYRQLVRALKPEEKKSALNPSCGTKRKRRDNTGPTVTKTGENVNNSDDEYENSTFDTPDVSSTDPMGKVYANFAQSLNPDQQRRFCGSLIDSYEFKDGGLMKKTISVKYQGTTHHIISYYSLEDVVAGKLKRPYQDGKLADIQPRPDLLTGWKVSLEDEESKDMPMVAGYSHQLQPSHIHHQQHLGAVTQSLGTHGLVQGHAPLHLQVPEYYSYTPTHQTPQSYSATSQYPPQQLPQYPAQQHSPHHYSQSSQSYPQASSPQPYASQQGSAQQYPSPATSNHQYTPQTQQAPQLPSEHKVASIQQQFQPSTTTSTYPASLSSQVPQPPQYTIPQAPVFDIHVPVHSNAAPEEHKSQSSTPQHDPSRRASAPVALQTYGQPQFHSLPQTSYYMDHKYTPNHTYGY